MTTIDARSDYVPRFVEAAEAVGCETTRTGPAEATDAIADATSGFTVGSAWWFDDVSHSDEFALPNAVVVDPSVAELERAETGVTGAPFAIAPYGTVAVPSTPALDGPISLYPERHVAVVRATDVEPDVGSALSRLADSFAAGSNDVVFVTGPSSTGDMGALVRGVHGPGEMHVVVIEE